MFLQLDLILQQSDQILQQAAMVVLLLVITLNLLA